MKQVPKRAAGPGVVCAAAWIGVLTSLAGTAPAFGQPAPIEVPPHLPAPSQPEPAPPPGPPPGQPEASAPEAANPHPAAAEDLRYLVGRFALEYGREAPDLPPLAELNDVKVELARTDSGFKDPAEAPADAPRVSVRVGEAHDPAAYFHASAIRRITTALVEELKRRGLVGLFVAPSPDDVDDATNDDLRQGRTAMRLQIWVGVVQQIRTIASGERLPTEMRIDNPLHRRIREGSVAHPGSLLTRAAIDDYVFRLNRHPGRRVDVAVSAYGDQTGDVVLDYLVSENKPWSIYAQVSNTGTRSTDEWRERVGFVHNQLTGNDDILRVDAMTAGLEETGAVLASYEFPLFDGRMRLKPYGNYSQFEASDLGIRDEKFSGNTGVGGLEGAYNILQFGPAFIDLIGGARWEHVEVSDDIQGTQGVDNFFLPYAGARFNRDTDEASTYGQFTFEGTLSEVSNTDPAELAQLGRRDVDQDWVVLKWEMGHQFYLEPLFNRAAWRGETTKGATLAHELAFQARGQWAFYDDRMIPQAEDVAGGFYSVRGYPESVVAGDTVYMFSAEYRLHIPRLLGVPATEEDRSANRSSFFGESFRWRPEQPFGRPDWDLIFRTFVDVARVENSRKIAGEQNDSLIGAGVGLELQLRRNIFIRTDFGWALDEIKDPDTVVSSGSSRLHFSATFVY